MVMLRLTGKRHVYVKCLMGEELRDIYYSVSQSLNVFI